MISFFRKIRKKLLTENKVTRYLIYALGEILLVVVGILIALWVNNLNEEKRAFEQEQNITNTLHNEFEENLKELKKDIARIDTQLVVNRQLLAFFGQPIPPDEFLLDSLILRSFANFTWNPSSYVLNDLKNSGQISTLSDKGLQLLLFRWERNYENVEEYKLEGQKSSDAFIEYLREYSSLRNIDYTGEVEGEVITRSKLGFSNQELLKDRRFENIVDDKLVATATLRQYYVRTMERIEEILKATQD